MGQAFHEGNGERIKGTGVSLMKPRTHGSDDEHLEGFASKEVLSSSSASTVVPPNSLIKREIQSSQSPLLRKEQIVQALDKLSVKLGEAEIHGAELRIVGGAALVLAHDLRESTKDVDAHLHPQEEARRIAKVVGEELGLPDGWLNDAFKVFMPSRQTFTTEGMPQFQNLIVLRPSDEMLFAMKAMASRIEEEAETPEESTDVKDLYALAKIIGLQNVDAMRELVHKYYPPTGPIQVPTRFWYLMDAYFSPDSE